MKKRKITIPAELDYLFHVRSFIEKTGMRNAFSHADIQSIMLAAEEACTNIIRHGYQNIRYGRIQIKAIISKSKFELIIIDQGQTFHPEGAESPDLDHYVETHKVGGLGIMMIKKLMDDIKYKVTRNGNEFHLIKYRENYKDSKLLQFKRKLSKSYL